MNLSIRRFQLRQSFLYKQKFVFAFSSPQFNSQLMCTSQHRCNDCKCNEMNDLQGKKSNPRNFLLSLAGCLPNGNVTGYIWAKQLILKKFPPGDLPYVGTPARLAEGPSMSWFTQRISGFVT